MRYKISLEESEEGFAASVLGLPGCHSQGATEDEALANIEAAIKEYLAVQKELWVDRDVREVEVEA
ncbi:MAG: type II toxin-antitoxin system HicB family antitoxin [Planctomycetales bacterium]|nr:type II toxin-antitoxin system HicB family antitoxin [Planctomycetales bacterium]